MGTEAAVVAAALWMRFGELRGLVRDVEDGLREARGIVEVPCSDEFAAKARALAEVMEAISRKAEDEYRRRRGQERITERLKTPEGQPRGYALRLGSAHFPHLKLQAVSCGDDGAWVFAVDTHDALRLEPGHPEAERWAQIQSANRSCKEQIERAWDEAGLLTFHGLLRQRTGIGNRE